ncbi:ABC transporter substrate-binding protein [Hydrogenophaga sp.]|uniref:ABC transporter substrate-binding protein n=1 Tax=Hydrogenophaga sp. TaxID=1904254 RepID=UPI00260ED717|nr:ABC transporter substrate-binding protein [Hydrogenophaga sp.]MDM7949387.1 ABC transporter substrate-binding protein [Hydrogenophaga sp.]
MARTSLLVATCALTMVPLWSAAQNLSIGLAAEPSSLDPHYHNLSPNNMLARHVFEALVGQDVNQKPRPGLAESWRTVDPLTWEFKLRKGVKFFDGSDFTADDVLATVKRLPNVPRSPSNFAPFIAGMQFEKVDSHTVRVKTASPAPLVPINLSGFSIVSQKCAESSTTEDFNALRCLGGTGPYKFSEFKPADRVVLVRNNAYWGPKAEWETVTKRFIASAPSRVAALLAGDVNVIDGVPPTDIPRLKSDANIEMAETLSNRVIYFHMDQFRETSPFITAKDGSAIKNPLLDRRVRQALSMAINRPAIVERLMDGAAVPAEQVLPKSFFGTSQKLQPTGFDLAGARRLLTEAGYPNGFKMKMHGPNGRYTNDTKIIEAVAQMFTRLGIDTEIETIPPANFFTRASTGANGQPEFSFMLLGWGATTGETLGPLRSLMGTFDRSKGSGAANRGRYSNPALDAKLTEASATVDDTKRAALLAEASEIAFNDFAIIPSHYQTNVWASRKGFKVEARADEYTLATGITRR